METVLINLAGGQRERIWRNGREYIRAPITSIVPGVLNGSKGALLYTPDDCAASVKDWDGQPLTYFHPTRNGHNVSAHERGVKERHWIGHVENTTFNGKLRKFGMFDVQWVSKLDQKYGGDVLNKLESGQPIEMSTGLFTDNEDVAGEYNGRRFDAIARNYRPDHVAILPGQVGACSVNDGCGVNVNKAKQTSNALSSATLGAGHRAPSALLDLTESQRGGGNTVYEGHDGEPEQIKADDTGEDWIKKPDEPEDVEMRQQASLLHRMLTMLLGRAPTHNQDHEEATDNSNPEGINQYTGGSGGGQGIHPASKEAHAATQKANRYSNAQGKSDKIGSYEAGRAHAAAEQAHRSAASQVDKFSSSVAQVHLAKAALHSQEKDRMRPRPIGNATYSNDKKMKGYGISGQAVHDAAVAGAAPAARANLIGDKAPQDGGRDADRLTKKPHGIQIGDAHDAVDEQSDASDDSDLTVVGKRNTALGADGKTMSDEAAALDDNQADDGDEMEDNCSTGMKVNVGWTDEARAAALAAKQASSKAEKSGSREDHLAAMKAHDKATQVHRLPEASGKSFAAMKSDNHALAADHHETQAGLAGVKAGMPQFQSWSHVQPARKMTVNQSPVNEDRKMKPFKIATNEDRDKALAVLNEGCKCSKEKSAFPLLNNATLEVLVANKLTKNEKAQGSNADASGSGAFSNAFDTGRDDGDSGDGAETTEDEDDYLRGKKQDPNREIPQTPPLKNQLSEEQWMRLAPPSVREATTNLLRREGKQKQQIAARLTSHIRDEGQRKRIVANLLRKSLAELEDELVLHARPEVAVQDPFDGTRRASFLGATGGYSEPTGNRQSEDADDVLETLTINLGLPVEEFNKAVDAHARRGGAAA